MSDRVVFTSFLSRIRFGDARTPRELGLEAEEEPADG